MNVDAQPYGKTLGLRCSSLITKLCLMYAIVIVLGLVRVLGRLRGGIYGCTLPCASPVGFLGDSERFYSWSVAIHQAKLDT